MHLCPERFTPPAVWRRFHTLDAHTAGEPFRVVIDGVPELLDPARCGATILARRRFAEEHLDDVRRMLVFEPRGHADMYGGFLTPPVSPGADLGILFFHNAGFSTMCGHGIIALTKVVLDAAMLPSTPPRTRLGIDAPAGFIEAVAHHRGDGKVERVAFRNVPSFVVELGATVEIGGELGTVHYDLAFGGAFYAYVDAAPFGLCLEGKETERLIDLGRTIKHAIMAQREIHHPFEDDLGFLYGVIFTGAARGLLGGGDGPAHSRHVCIFADGEVDRSPTGTGVSGRLAILHARDEVGIGERVEIESILGTSFTGQAVERTQQGPYAAIVPEVEGRAHLTGRQELWLDPNDPVREGFLLR